jgi:hypothetical protein
MLLPFVDVPFSLKCRDCGRHFDKEQALAISLAGLVPKLAEYYLHVGPNKPFLALLDFSLMNIGIDQKTKHVQFIDLESFEVIDGSEGTFMIGENVIDGHHILTAELLDSARHPLETIHRRLQMSTVVMLMILAVKALQTSKDKTLDNDKFTNVMRRPPISALEVRTFVTDFNTLFNVDMRGILKAIEFGAPCELAPCIADNVPSLSRMLRRQTYAQLGRALGRFTTSYSKPIARDCSKNIMLFDCAASAMKIASGSFGTIIKNPLTIKGQQNFVMKVWDNVVSTGPTCRLCPHSSPTLTRHNLIHYCHYCRFAVCRNHLPTAISSRTLHAPQCRYIAGTPQSTSC